MNREVALKFLIFLRLWILVLILLVFVVNVSVLFLHFMISINRQLNRIGEGGKESEQSGIIHEYQMLRLNTLTNEISTGMLSSFGVVEENDYSISVNGNDMVLVSNFGTSEYICTGSCVCEDLHYRRKSVGVISTGLQTLLVAVSSIVAYKLAHDHFQEECIEIFSDQCALSSVKSNVEDCSLVLAEDGGIMVRDRDLMTGGKYMCKGNCLMRGIGEKERENIQKGVSYLQKFNINIPFEELEKIMKRCEQVKQEMEIEVFANENPNEKFVKQHLETTCFDFVKREIDLKIHKVKLPRFLVKTGLKLMAARDISFWSPCIGKRINGENETVRCRKLIED